MQQYGKNKMNNTSTFMLKERTALITGSSRGIGAALATGLAQAGTNIVVHYAENVDAANQVCKSIQAFGGQAVSVQGDLRDANAVEQIVVQSLDAFGRIDILIHNASIQYRTDWLAITHEQALEQFNANLFAALHLAQRLAPPMVERGWGRMLMIGSVQQTVPHPEMAIYAASKAALENLTRNLAKQLAPTGVTVNTLAPGVIDTDRNKLSLDDTTYLQRVLEKIPANRVGQPEDCVGAALLLCSDASSYITGQTLYIDGGMSL